MTCSRTDAASWQSYIGCLESPVELTRNLANIASRSGNYLLNVGPDGQGRIPTESVTRLKQMGDWLRANGAGDMVTITPSGGPTNDIATVIEITVRAAARQLEAPYAETYTFTTGW